MQNNIKFEKISIIGCGLIGSSILRNINKKEISRSITVFDKSKEVIDIIKKEKLCDEISRDIPSAVKDSDLIILCVPLSSYKEILLSAKLFILPPASSIINKPAAISHKLILL